MRPKVKEVFMKKKKREKKKKNEKKTNIGWNPIRTVAQFSHMPIPCWPLKPPQIPHSYENFSNHQTRTWFTIKKKWRNPYKYKHWQKIKWNIINISHSAVAILTQTNHLNCKIWSNKYWIVRFIPKSQGSPLDGIVV